MRKALEFAEKAFTVLSLLHYSGGPIVVILAGGVSEGEAAVDSFDPVPVRVLYLFNYIVTTLLVFARWKKAAYILSKDRFLWVLITIAALSIFWSANPTITQSRIIGLIGTSLFALYIATRYSLKQQVQLLGWVFGLAVILSLIFIVALPKYGIMGGVHAGAWRGIYPHKNSAGIIMMLSSIIFLLLAMSEKKKSLILWSGFGLSVIILLLTRSTSSLLNLINLLTTLFVFRTLRLRIGMMVPMLCLIASISASLYVIIQTNPDSLFASFGKSSNLSGRSELWAAVLDVIWKRPLLGYGYGAFWLGEGSEAVNIWYVVGWKAPYAHNGWLDTWLTLGLFGLITCITGFIFSFLRSIYWVCRTKTLETCWPGICIVYMFLANMTESVFMVQNGFSWILYLTAALSVLPPPEKPNEKLIYSRSQNSEVRIQE
ncbi:MAG TPA: O-antigen ligase [Nostocaceae cyanobacterium]|nr:O-antigen ligase [Nostocaceae cyanobacterium]